MALYETIFILDSLLASEEIDKIIERVKHLIEEQGAKTITIDKWGKRRFAYEIQKKQYGFYVSLEFEGSGNLPKVLQNEYNYNDKVLRYLTYRFDKKKLKHWQKEKQEAQQLDKKLTEEQKADTESKEKVNENAQT